MMQAAGDESGLRKVKVTKKGKDGRIAFQHEDRTIYEWEQSLEEVNIYIEAPPGVRGSKIECKIEPRRLRIGLKGNPPFIDESTPELVVVDESTWTMGEDGEINVTLQKAKRGVTWGCALMGRGQQEVDPVTKQEMQRSIMLERFQAENPGFDFSQAEFNGAVPDASTFMGGVR